MPRRGPRQDIAPHTASSGMPAAVRLVEGGGRSSSVHVVFFTLAELLAGVQLEVPEPALSRRLGPPSAQGGRRKRYSKEKVTMAQGTVKWFNPDKGFGFINVDGGGPDVFVHYSAIDSGGYRSLEEDQRVEFDVTQGPKGPQAERVRVI